MKFSIFKLKTFVLAVSVLFISATAWADSSRSIKADYPATKISDRVYVVYGPLGGPTKENQGFRNNVTFVITKAGVVVIDPGTSVYVGDMVLKKIKDLTDRPVVAVFNTHVHGDHWLGNQAFKIANPKVKIYGHPNMIQQAKDGEGDRWIGLFNAATDNAVTGTKPVIPNIAVKNGQAIKIGELDFRIHSAGPAHTDGDIMIEIPQEKVVLTGDLVRAGLVGIAIVSFKGNLAAMDRALKLKANIYIPGHGTAGNKEVVLTYRKLIDGIRGTVAKHYDSGLADYQIKPLVLKVLADYKKWVLFDKNIGRLVSLAYLEIQDEAFQ